MKNSQTYNTQKRSVEFSPGKDHFEKARQKGSRSWIFSHLFYKSNKYLVIDSLSSLLIYNDPSLVTEFFTHLTNRTRLSEIHTISLAIEEEVDDRINKVLYLKSNRIIKVRESFI